MLSSPLNDLLAPFAKLANKNALTNLYKALLVDEQGIAGCAPWGIVTAAGDLGISQPFWIDAAAFINVMKSLPKDEVKFNIKSGALHWECGAAEGKLALLSDIEMPETDWSPLKKKGLNPDKKFIDALVLGSLSCGPESMSSAGLHGAVIENADDGVRISSSDNITLSVASAGDTQASWPDKVTLKPDALGMLDTILKYKAENTRLIIQEKAVFVRSGPFRAMLRPAPALKNDIAATARGFGERDSVATLPKEAVANFIKRAAALASVKQNTFVTLKAAEGGISLGFEEGAATSDEYYLIDGLTLPNDLPQIKLDAMRMARVLAHADKICLGHIERGVLVFFQDSPRFDYLVCGIEENKEG